MFLDKVQHSTSCAGFTLAGVIGMPLVSHDVSVVAVLEGRCAVVHALQGILNNAPALKSTLESTLESTLKVP